MLHKVLAKQSIYDVSIMSTGTADNAFAIALANSLSVTDELVVGSFIIVPDTLVKQAKVLQYLSARNIQIATALDKKPERNFDYEFPQGECPISL